jgi:hypothetical protein
MPGCRAVLVGNLSIHKRSRQTIRTIRLELSLPLGPAMTCNSCLNSLVFSPMFLEFPTRQTVEICNIRHDQTSGMPISTRLPAMHEPTPPEVMYFDEKGSQQKPRLDDSFPAFYHWEAFADAQTTNLRREGLPASYHGTTLLAVANSHGGR